MKYGMLDTFAYVAEMGRGYLGNTTLVDILQMFFKLAHVWRIIF